MSAIAGIYHNSNEPITMGNGYDMMRCFREFPADDSKVFHKGNVFLGCHAQWITPESVGEPLPFYETERQLAITADAIIDNRNELFDRLQVERAKRCYMPDSQIILLAYQKWGENCPKYLIGDFAFVIWDEKERKLFGARDFSGARTLYYYFGDNKFAFSSLINPLLTLPDLRKDLNEYWIAEYLAISGTIDTVDAASTPYKGVEQLPPSHSFLIENGGIKLERYCTVTEVDKLRLNSDEDYIEAFQSIFQDAVDARLRTHHNVGSQLSGGLDSGAVVSFASKSMKREKKTLHTFSYIPPKDFVDFTPSQLLADESPYINATVKHVGTVQQHFLDFPDKDPYTEIDFMLSDMEMPYKFFENAFWLKGMFEKAHDHGIGVLLNGDRGNFSISWGSAIDYYAILLRHFKWIKLLQELSCYSYIVGGPRFRRIPTIAGVAFPGIHNRISNKKSWKLPMVINSEFAEQTGVFHKLKLYGMDQTGWFPNANIYAERKKMLQNIFPWNTGNTLASKLSLRYSVWKRDPTNDLRVVRFCLAIPNEQFVKNGLDRALIRNATENILPNQVRLNQKIRGVQGADWVHRMKPYWDSFIQDAAELLQDDRFLKLLNASVLRQAMAKVSEGPRPEYAIDPDYKILMRTVILYRFIKRTF